MMGSSSLGGIIVDSSGSAPIIRVPRGRPPLSIFVVLFLNSGLGCGLSLFHFLQRRQIGNVLSPGIELRLRKAVLSGDLLLDDLVGAFDFDRDGQSAVFFIVEPHFDGCLGGQVLR